METGERLFCKHCKTCAMNFRGNENLSNFQFQKAEEFVQFFVTRSKGENSKRQDLKRKKRKEDEDCCVIVERG